MIMARFFAKTSEIFFFHFFEQHPDWFSVHPFFYSSGTGSPFPAGFKVVGA